LFSTELVLRIHEEIIMETGGTLGVRDKNLLESSLKQPFQTFEEKELYPSAEEKAAKLIEAIIKNHPFIDGNKRVAYVLFRLFLEENGLKIIADEDEKFNFVTGIASGRYDFSEIIKWVKTHVK